MKSFSSKLFQLFHFTIYLRLLLEAFLFSFLAALSELIRVGDAPANIISYLLSVMYIIFSVCFVIFVLLYYLLKRDITRTEYFIELYEGFKPKVLAKLYFFIFLVRRALIVVIILALRDTNVYIRLSLYFIIQMVTLVYVI